MGREIDHSSFTPEEHQQFRARLVEETRKLSDMLCGGEFSSVPGVCGLELEGWLLDRNWQPAPRNEAFLKNLHDPFVVPELSRFNFEINTTPQPPSGHMFRSIHHQLTQIWARCEKEAGSLGMVPLHIGILPTLRDNVMTLANMSPMQRYYALNEQVLRKRRGSPLDIDIAGRRDRLKVRHQDVMTEAATTSLQIHVQLDPSSAVRYFNSAHILSAPMVAACANSPYLFGHELWEESRIPLFEQSVAVPAFYDGEGHLVERVTLGTRYLSDSVMELFEENCNAFPVLLPMLYQDSHQLEHLRLHNGTIWRWNRPLIDYDRHGRPTLRLEHRVAPGGPSMPDVVANIMFFYGLLHYLAGLAEAPEHRLGFEHATANFYQAARYGLGATVFWLDGHEYRLQDLLHDELIPAAAFTLEALGVASEDVDLYVNRIFSERVAGGQTGAAWQRRFVEKHGADFTALTRAYYENQSKQLPVHLWKI